ncbi:MAG: hypothetical protein KBA07_03910 [Petrotogaceae bacterium]|nr:hypothetical protein [Petrotogaceae bacterium]
MKKLLILCTVCMFFLSSCIKAPENALLVIHIMETNCSQKIIGAEVTIYLNLKKYSSGVCSTGIYEIDIPITKKYEPIDIFVRKAGYANHTVYGLEIEKNKVNLFRVLLNRNVPLSIR